MGEYRTPLGGIPKSSGQGTSAMYFDAVLAHNRGGNFAAKRLEDILPYFVYGVSGLRATCWGENKAYYRQV